MKNSKLGQILLKLLKKALHDLYALDIVDMNFT